VLEEALSSACGHPVTVTGSSRTDAGVHALDQKVHFDTDCTIPPDKYPFVLNTMLPPDIRVLDGREVPPDFHARFLTAGKTYTYRIWNARHGSAMRRNTHWHIPVPLNEDPVRRALLTLPGKHDFAAFQAAGGSARSTVRRIDRADLSVAGPEITLTVSGNAFLYNMVRIIAGTLVEIGLNKLDTDAFQKAYVSLSRLDLGMTAPPCGLELTSVLYPDTAFTDPASLRWHEGD
jgi:tRNA pseudouridine38-40 synthase